MPPARWSCAVERGQPGGRCGDPGAMSWLFRLSMHEVPLLSCVPVRHRSSYELPEGPGLDVRVPATAGASIRLVLVLQRHYVCVAWRGGSERCRRLRLFALVRHRAKFPQEDLGDLHSD